jgi:FkbM family methyltransferase
VVDAYFAHQGGGLSRRGLAWAVLHALPECSLLSRTRHGWLSYSNKDLAIGRLLFLEGEFEYPLIRRALALLRELHELRTGLLIDAGANIGTVTVTLLREGFFRRAIAVEPIPSSYRRLTRNLWLNGLRHRVRPIRAALGPATGSVSMTLSPINPGDHRVRILAGLAVDQMEESTWPTVEVVSRRLDDVVRPQQSVGLLWMDVQGFELRVLEGARRLLATGMPVVLEFAPYWMAQAGVSVEEYCAFFAERFRVVYDLAAPVPTAIPASEVATLFKRYQELAYSDLLALPV